MSLSSSSQQQQPPQHFMMSHSVYESAESSFSNSNHNNTQLMTRSHNYSSSAPATNNNNNHSALSTNNDQNNNPNNNNPSNANVNLNPSNSLHEVVDASSGTMESISNSRRDFFQEIRNGGGHWSQLLRQVVLTPPAHLRNPGEDMNDSTTPDEEMNNGNPSLPVIPLQILGGSENGHFAYVGLMNSDINGWIAVGYLQPGDVILDIQGQQVRWDRNKYNN